MNDSLLDVLTLVSSDKRFPLETSSLMASGQVRVVHTFRTGSECLRALELDDQAAQRIVLIDQLVSDISPANLCDAIRNSHPDLSIVLVVEDADVQGIQRAMLAGAKATISRQANSAELTAVLERVVESARHVASKVQGLRVRGPAAALSSHLSLYDDYGQRAVLLPFIGARGGAGRSTLSSALAWLAAQAHVDTALIDFDLQFGDLNFLFGTTGTIVSEGAGSAATAGNSDNITSLNPSASTHNLSLDAQSFLEELAQGADNLRGTGGMYRFGRQLAPHLRLYAFSAAPEKTELLAKSLPDALDMLRSQHQLLVVNTGAYWTLFHSQLLEQSDLAVCVLDQSIVGVRATSELRDMCRRLGIPTSRLLFAMNRIQRSGLNAAEVAQVLHADKLIGIHDAGPQLSELFESGDMSQLSNQGRFLSELYQLLDEVAVRTDLSLHDSATMRYAMRRDGRFGAAAGKGLSSSRAETVAAPARRGLLRRA